MGNMFGTEPACVATCGKTCYATCTKCGKTCEATCEASGSHGAICDAFHVKISELQCKFDGAAALLKAAHAAELAATHTAHAAEIAALRKAFAERH